MKNRLTVCFISYLVFQTICLSEFGIDKFIDITLASFFAMMIWFVIVCSICVSILYIREVKERKNNE